MALVVRFVTLVDLNADDAGPEASRLSVSATLFAQLDDGRRVLLLDDRGWGSQTGIYWEREPTPEERASVERPSAWAGETVQDMEEMARTVVGPDEPAGEETHEQMAADYWQALADILRGHGLEVDPGALGELAHDVELSERVRERIPD